MSDDYNILKVIKGFLLGTLKFASDEVVTHRTSICEPCEARNSTLNTCTICSCYIPTKTRLLESTCPMEKWKK